ncbi:MAG TPA: ATP-binding protein [Chloroflexota bacterium]|nr:ATP-binding protein [Chloroflexota bacterium]
MSRVSDLSIASRLQELASVRSWIEEQAEAAGFSKGERFELSLAATEACANVIEHAYEGRTDGRIDLHLEIEGPRFELTVRDFGTPFDVSAYQQPDLQQPHEGGYGVHLMNSLMDEVRYAGCEPGTCLTLVKHRRG